MKLASVEFADSRSAIASRLTIVTPVFCFLQSATDTHLQETHVKTYSAIAVFAYSYGHSAVFDRLICCNSFLQETLVQFWFAQTRRSEPALHLGSSENIAARRAKMHFHSRTRSRERKSKSQHLLTFIHMWQRGSLPQKNCIERARAAPA